MVIGWKYDVAFFSYAAVNFLHSSSYGTILQESKRENEQVFMAINMSYLI